jgi:hypothetical protein
MLKNCSRNLILRFHKRKAVCQYKNKTRKKKEDSDSESFVDYGGGYDNSQKVFTEIITTPQYDNPRKRSLRNWNQNVKGKHITLFNNICWLFH